MNWEQAKELIAEKIYEGLDLDPSKQFKIVAECGDDYFKVKVGTKTPCFISYEQLRNVFERTLVNKGIYENAILKQLYPRELINSPCLVHSIGKLFVHAGIMKQDSKYVYKIIK